MNRYERIKDEIERLRCRAVSEKNKAQGHSHDGYCSHLAEENLCQELLDFIKCLELAEDANRVMMGKVVESEAIDIEALNEKLSENMAAKLEDLEIGKRWKPSKEQMVDDIDEDERIRKELVESFSALDIDSKWNGIPVKSILAWLEALELQPMPEDTVIFQKGVEEGKRLQREELTQSL